MAEMLRGNNSSDAAEPFLISNGHFQHPAFMSNQPQLCGNLPLEFHADPVNYLGYNLSATFPQPEKCGQDVETIPIQQDFRFFLNNEIDRKASMKNPISTGLRLSYDDDDHEQSNPGTYGSGNFTSSVFSTLSNHIKKELDRQKEELDQFLRFREETLAKGLRDIRQRHTTSILTALEKRVLQKLREKDLELESVTSKNKELHENMKHLTAETQNWCYIAKYNESVVNILKSSLQQAIQNSNHRREGFGESEVDDAASCIDPNNYLGSACGSGRSALVKPNMICRSCNSKEVSVVLMPCRHLCMCKECERFVNACPVCQMKTTDSFTVYLS